MEPPGVSVEDGPVAEKAAAPEIMLWGVNMSGYSKKNLFTAFAGGALVSAVVFSYLQEMIFTMPGFHFGGLVSLMTTLTYSGCAGLDGHFFLGGLKRNASIKEFLLLSLFPAAGMYFTNWSLEYLNYPTRIMFKSSKVIPVMVVGTFMQKKTYTAKQYGNAALLVTGLAIFCLGEKELSPEFSGTGIVLILLGVSCDAITSNYEEHTFFQKHGCSYQEVTFYAYLFGSLWTAIAMLATGEAYEAYTYAQENPAVLSYGVVSSIAGYTSVVFVLLLIQHFGATITEVVKSCRKVFSIVISYTLLKPKPFGDKHYMGGLIFMASLAIGAYR